MNLAISPHQTRMMREYAALERQQRELEAVMRLKRQCEQIQEMERLRKLATQVQDVERIRKIVELNEMSATLKILQSARQRVLEIERVQQAMEIFDRVRRQMATVLHARPTSRNKAGSNGAGRTSGGKKSAKSTGGDSGGGDSDGDGEGPHRTRPTKRRPKKNRNTSPTRSPSSAPGAIVPPQFPPVPSQFPPVPPSHHTPRQSPPPELRRADLIGYLTVVCFWSLAFTAESGATKVLAIILFAVVALSVIGHSDVAKMFLTSKAISTLMARLFGKDGAE